jgi:hypothetical protein
MLLRRAWALNRESGSCRLPGPALPDRVVVQPLSAQKRPIAEATGQTTLQSPLVGDMLPMR